ncbi:hypothetical protein M9H77_17411 [Catharanthus roseus]|uniref:Uncharacterized protein n=1 Tax=Catharanthus roseus TaxID=4058 RepID=A0ACC0B4L1_CATRO|nr:hypothetical protein M9H77_17411 [Catharanthus roseus]
MSGFMKTSLPLFKRCCYKPQVSTYKGFPKKDDTPKVPFKDSYKPNMEEKAINYPTKKTLIFREDLNGWIEKDEDDCLEDIFDEKENHNDELWKKNRGTRSE